jgi:hypothetical protein
MKGHLIVAKELMDARKLDEAEPHIGHPVEELYATVEPELKERNVPEFKSVLMQLHGSVKAKSDPSKMNPEYEAAMKAIDRAIAAIPATQLQDPTFVLAAINGVLATAQEEYSAAIAMQAARSALVFKARALMRVGVTRSPLLSNPDETLDFS